MIKKDISQGLMPVEWHQTRWKGLVYVRRWVKRDRTNFYWCNLVWSWEVVKVSRKGKILLACIGSMWFGGIETFWAIKLCTKTWYNSKIFTNFAYFFVLFLWPKCLDTPKSYTTEILIHQFLSVSHKKIYQSSVSFLCVAKCRANFFLYSSTYQLFLPAC